MVDQLTNCPIVQSEFTEIPTLSGLVNCPTDRGSLMPLVVLISLVNASVPLSVDESSFLPLLKEWYLGRKRAINI